MAKVVTLRSQREIDEVFRRGLHQRGRHMKVVVLRHGGECPRALFVTGKRLGGAVVRNRTRRRLREAFRAILPQVEPGCDVAMIAYNGRATYRELSSELLALLARAGVVLPEGSK